MTTETKTFVLGYVTMGSWPGLHVIKADDSGQPLFRTAKKWTGKWDDSSRPIYRGTERVVTTFSPLGYGHGNAREGLVRVTDPTPRTWEDAMAKARNG